ncbi:MAG: hypothetical protein JWQ39_850 [Glaciihabitans sp.]|jgi:hypothetical protein|nr:hypothetical protein [Glaciihabitans sp.]
MISNTGRHDVTQSTPRTLSGRPSEQAQFEAELASWLDFVSRATRKRLRLEKLITARGILKPVTLAQRFVIKSREVGFIPTVKLVNTRLRQMKQSDQ